MILTDETLILSILSDAYKNTAKRKAKHMLHREEVLKMVEAATSALESQNKARLSKREQFALAVLQGISARVFTDVMRTQKDDIVRTCYELADAMIKASDA